MFFPFFLLFGLGVWLQSYDPVVTYRIIPDKKKEELFAGSIPSMSQGHPEVQLPSAGLDRSSR
jgi:hypothetical protein